MTPGYAPDIFGYLFGSILTVPAFDLILMLILDLIIIGVVASLYKEFLALAFDEEFGSVVGIPTERLYLLLLCMIGVTAVVLIRVVSINLVIALLTAPAAIAWQFTHSLKRMMLVSVLIGVVLAFGGLWLSYELDLASGSTIILFGGALMLACVGFSRLRRRKLIGAEGKSFS